MAVFGAKWRGVKSVCMVLFHFAVAFLCIKAERGLKLEKLDATNDYVSGNGYLSGAVSFLWQSDSVGYRHVWPARRSVGLRRLELKPKKEFDTERAKETEEYEKNRPLTNSNCKNNAKQEEDYPKGLIVAFTPKSKSDKEFAEKDGAPKGMKKEAGDVKMEDDEKDNKEKFFFFFSKMTNDNVSHSLSL